MPKGLLYSTDGGATFNTVSVDVADYTLPNGSIANYFFSTKDSQDNAYILCCHTYVTTPEKAKLITIKSNGTKTVNTLNWDRSATITSTITQQIMLSRDEQYLFIKTINSSGIAFVVKIAIPITSGNVEYPSYILPAGAASGLAIYQDRYTWIASGTTVKIYDYDTKAELASLAVTAGSLITCSSDNTLYGVNENWVNNGVVKYVFNGIDTITKTVLNASGITNNKQLLIDRFGDLVILTNTGTASTLLKYSNTGTLIDTVSLSVGTNKGAYGLQVYSKDNGTKCWVQFGNDLGTWKTAETTAQGQVFGVVSKLSAISTGELTYGDDNGGDNSYSVWCP